MKIEFSSLLQVIGWERREERGKRKEERGEWRVESGECRAESGEWRVESVQWRVYSGEWRGVICDGKWVRKKEGQKGEGRESHESRH